MQIKTFDMFKQYATEHNIERCLIRCDLNLPSDVEDLSRVYAIKDTIQEILDLGLCVSLISHYKRPSIEEKADPKFSLRNIVSDVQNVLNQSIEFVEGSVFEIDPESVTAKIALFENLRFYEGETKDSEELARRLAEFGDVYINDAFSVSHRKHASIHAITKFLPSFAGISLQKEIEGISKVTSNIKNPFSAIIGGSKISSKIGVLKTISQTADYLIITGAMANTFMVAKGVDMKNSKIELEQIETAKEILKTSKAAIILPEDFMAADSINSVGENFDVDQIPNGFSCFDIGEKTTEKIINTIDKSKTLLWNGAIGAFEFSNFDKATNIIAAEIAKMTKEGKLSSVIGGGETIASIKDFKNDMTFVSTAGGAFLEFVAGSDLPGIKALETRTSS